MADTLTWRGRIWAHFSAFFARFPKVWKAKIGDSAPHDPIILLRRETIRELGIYFAFMLILNIVIFGSASVDRYYLTSVYRELLVNQEFGNENVTFETMTSVDHVWQYLEEVLLPSIYFRYDYAGNRDEPVRKVVFENFLLGVPRLRQVRVRNDTCDISSEFSGIVKKCYSPYTFDAEDVEPFGPGIGTAWNYHTESELAGPRFRGYVATYSGGGNYEDLGTGYEEAECRVAALKQLNWIQRGSRLVVLDFSTYNANVNLIAFVRIAFELPGTGGVVPSCSIQSMTFLRYLTNWDTCVMVCEVLFSLFTGYYIVEEIKEIRKDWKTYVRQAWNYMDDIILIISVFCNIFGIYRTLLIQAVAPKLFVATGQFLNFETLAYWNTVHSLLIAILSFLCWIKIFKYIRFNLTMVQLSTTLTRCSKDVAGFGIMFFIIFFAYAELGFLLFGNQLEEYMFLHNSMFTLLRTILGDFDLHAIERVDKTAGSIFFVTYVLIVFFVLLNMFLAIINDTYMEVKAELKAKFPNGGLLTSVLNTYAMFARKYSKVRGRPHALPTRQQTEMPSQRTKSVSPQEPRVERKLDNGLKQQVKNLLLKNTPTLSKGASGPSNVSVKLVLPGKKQELEGNEVAKVSITRKDFEMLGTTVDELMEKLKHLEMQILPQLKEMPVKLNMVITKSKAFCEKKPFNRNR